jgi:hypothetical protein
MHVALNATTRTPQSIATGVNGTALRANAIRGRVNSSARTRNAIRGSAHAMSQLPKSIPQPPKAMWRWLKAISHRLNGTQSQEKTMYARQKQIMASLERVQDFLEAFPLPKTPAKFAQRRGELDAAVGRLRVLLGEQSSGRREAIDSTKRQAAARVALVENDLKPINRIARAMLPNEPLIKSALALPTAQTPSQKLIAEASGIRASAAKFAPVFIENGRPEDFLERLDASIEALRQSLLVRARTVGQHVGARAGMAQTLADAQRVVRILDAMVQDGFAGNPDVLAKWRVAKRVKEVGSVRATGGTAEENLMPTSETKAA